MNRQETHPPQKHRASTMRRRLSKHYCVINTQGTINANPQHYKDTVRVDLNTIVEELAIPCVQENTIVPHTNTTTNLNLHFYLF